MDDGSLLEGAATAFVSLFPTVVGDTTGVRCVGFSGVAVAVPVAGMVDGVMAAGYVTGGARA